MDNGSVFCDICVPEAVIRVKSKAVVRLAHSKIQIEVGLVEIENPIIINQVKTIGFIRYPDCTMPESGKNFSLIGP